ncbi:uncharacterized protein LOC128235562, partial [Mya arenaria]|uniref:uncharacterized protein LOC128235562 n=1 Tax=Mya arenaria TaxID=6604 RepID=UPI0022E53EA0
IFSLTNVGKSSKNLNCKLFHSDTNKQFVSCDVADVLVDPETRKPTPIPTWWTDEFGKGIPTFKPPDPPFSDVEKNGDLYQSETKVMYSDTDSYQHCNWTSYMKFSYDSMMDHLIRGGGYDWVTLDDVKAGIRDVDILYRSEAMLGDTLTVQSWSTRGDKCENKEKSLLFNVLNVGTSCFQAKMTFFSPNPSLNAHSAL